MVTFAGTQNKFTDALKAIVELDYDAIKAYQAAIDRLQDPIYKQKLEEFKGDHQRHVDTFSHYLTQHSITPPSGPDLKGILTEGKVKIASLSTDRTILKAMLNNEQDTVEAYENINSHPDKPTELSESLSRALNDEHRHQRWLDQEIESEYKATGS